MFCCCMSLKCGIIFIGIILIIDFFLECLNLYFIAENPYFDSIYPTIFAIILIPLAVVCGFFFYWFCKDSRESRKLLPIGLIIGAIAELALFIWIIVYICFIYQPKSVYVNKWDKQEYSDDSDGSHYQKQSKATYIFNHALSPLFGALLYWTSYCIVRDWEKRHANQDRSYG